MAANNNLMTCSIRTVLEVATGEDLSGGQPNPERDALIAFLGSTTEDTSKARTLLSAQFTTIATMANNPFAGMTDGSNPPRAYHDLSPAERIPLQEAFIRSKIQTLGTHPDVTNKLPQKKKPEAEVPVCKI